jgi:hypothetical protein
MDRFLSASPQELSLASTAPDPTSLTAASHICGASIFQIRPSPSLPPRFHRYVVNAFEPVCPGCRLKEFLEPAMETRPVSIARRSQLATVGRCIKEVGTTCADSLGVVGNLGKIRLLDLDHSHTFVSVLQYDVTERDQSAREILQNAGQ